MATNPTAVRVGPGTLYVAPIGTAEPTGVSGTWPSGWVPLGYTDKGSEFNYNLTVGSIDVAESLDPVAYVTTGRVIQVVFDLAQTTLTNLQLAMNAGLTLPNPSGGYYTFEPPALGAETRVMLGWDATDGMERWVYRRAFQNGNVKLPRQKAPNKTVIPVQFSLEIPSAGTNPFKVFIAQSLGS